MKKFWIIAVNGVAHMMNERFYSYQEALDEAEKRAKLSPNNTFLVLGLKMYVKGKNNVTVIWDGEDYEEITVRKNTTSLITVELTDSDGNPLSLEGLQVQFIILPNKNSPDSEAIFNETKRWVDPEVDPYPENGFQSNAVEYLIDATVIPEVANYWYQVRIMYDAHPEDNDVYQEGDFLVIENL